MTQSVRYQIFLSSTFTDLREERAEVLQAIWELDCIPTGMEAFLATNEAQWEVIQKLIDECDYYVLLIGGRYGSTTEDGISYTEKEYNYVKSLGIPVLCFVHGDPENIPVSKSEKEETSRARLATFRSRVMEEHPVRRWTNAQELGGIVSRSISRAIKVNPRPGWVRNTGSSNLELLEQINNLTKENSKLKERTPSKSVVEIKNLQSGGDITDLRGTASIYRKDESKFNTSNVNWKVDLNWNSIFGEIGPILVDEASTDEISTQLTRFIGWDTSIDHKNFNIRSRYFSPESLSGVIVQLRALGLIEKGTRKRAVSDRSGYWKLTEEGDRYLISLLAKRKKVEDSPKALEL